MNCAHCHKKLKPAAGYETRKKYCDTKCQANAAYARDRKVRAQKVREYQRNNPEKIRARKRRALTGWTQEEYDRAYKEQKGLCAICGISANKCTTSKNRQGLVADHNHKTKNKRGLLCGKCNTAIGLLNDDVEICKKVIQYLERTDQ